MLMVQPCNTISSEVNKNKTSLSFSNGKKPPVFFQPKLAIASIDDPQEREADYMADQVMRQPSNNEPPFFSPQPFIIKPVVQTKCVACEEAEEEKLQRKEDEPDGHAYCVQRTCAQGEDEDENKNKEIIQKKTSAEKSSGHTDSVEKVLQSPGQALDNGTRSFMENRFGHSFSNVRIHNDIQAYQSSADINALAYTHKNHIAFASGQYQPGTETGKKLLAHELTHVVQQGSSQEPVQRAPDDEPNATDEFIPTATYSITVSGIIFTTPPEATFQPGKKMPQLIRILLKTLLQEEYKEDLVEPITAALIKRGFLRGGHFASTKDAYQGELIGTFFLEIDPFSAVQSELQKRGLSAKLTGDDLVKLEEAYYQYRLWEDFKKISKQEGMPLPAWYGKGFFDFQIQQDRFLLDNYMFFGKEYLQNQDDLSHSKLVESVDEVFNTVYTPIVILDEIRKDTALSANPETQLAYVSMWKVPDKSKKDKVPAYIESFKTVTDFLKFAVKEPDFKDAETTPEARTTLLRKFQASDNFKADTITVLPPFPSFIVAPDLNPDHTTITSAENYFRMIVDFGAMHGSDIHGVTIAMAMDMYFSWKAFPMPASLKALKGAPGMSPEAMVEAVNDFVKTSPANLGEPVATYSPDDDRERTISMSSLGVGDFVLMGLASPSYREDLKWIQQPSTAGHPIFVFDAADLARMSTYSDWDTLQSLKEQAKDAEPDKKEELEKEIQRLEARETTDLLSITKQDLDDTQKLHDSAIKLKEFIEEDRKKNLSRQGNQSTDPFIIRLKTHDTDLYNLFIMVGQMFDLSVYGDQGAVEKFIEVVSQQIKELTSLKKRTEGAYGSFKSIDDETPTFRTVAALVKEDDGNLVPLLMVSGYHPDADPKRGIHKIKLVDVTFEAPDKEEMIYVGNPVLDMSVADELSDEELFKWRMQGAEEVSSEQEAKGKAIDSAMEEFGGYNNYGEGKILYRIPGTPYRGEADSITTTYEYLQMAIAALGLVVLVLGVVASFGTLTPAAAAIVMALGISVAVVGAIMSMQNISERDEKGTLAMDTEMALDIINIIGAVVIGVGQIAKLTITASKLSQISKVMQLARLEKSLLLYDAVDFSANVFLVSVKVKEDIDAIKKLDVPEHMKDNMIAAVTFDAIQQGAIMGVGARGLGKQAVDYHRTKVETSQYKSLIDRGWIELDVDGKMRVTEKAPPFLRDSELAKKPASPDSDDQGQAARVVVEQEMLATVKTVDGENVVTLTDKGRIIHCSNACQDLRVKYEKQLLDDPELQQRLVDIEAKGEEAATAKNDQLTEQALADAKVLEGDLAAVMRRESVKSYKDVKTQAGWKEMRDYRRLLAKLEASNVSPGHLQDIFDNAVKNGENENFVASLYAAISQHEKSPMSNFKKLIDGLASKNEEVYRTARSLVERMSIVRTKEKGAKQVDRILGRFSMEDLATVRRNHASGAQSDVEIINALDSIIAKTDESSGKIIDLIGKAADPSTPDKPDLLRLQDILDRLPAGQKYKAEAIEDAIIRSNEFAANVKEAMADPKHGFEKLAKEIWGDSAVDGGKIEVEERFREGVKGSGEEAYHQIIKADNRGDKLAAGVVDGDKIDMAKWEVVKNVINQSNIATGIKNNVIGELWARINILKLKAQGYDVLREVVITDGVTTAKADLVAIKDGEIRILECKAMAGGLSDQQKKIYPYLERGEFDKVKIEGNASLDSMLRDPKVSKSYELVRDTAP